MTPIDIPGISSSATAYPAATRHGDLLFVSGQVSFDDDGTVAFDGDIRGQIRQTLTRLGRVLDAVDIGPSSVASATVYLTDASNAAILNEEWRAWFGEHRPARATVIAGLLDDRLLVEISAVCVLSA